MTKKTKKKKIIADYRRKLQILEVQQHRNELRLDEPVKKKVAQENRSAVPIVQTKQITLSSLERESLEKQAQHIARDLKRTLLLSVIGIGVIFGLYFFAPL